jgi:hypothetical protein
MGADRRADDQRRGIVPDRPLTTADRHHGLARTTGEAVRRIPRPEVPIETTLRAGGRPDAPFGARDAFARPARVAAAWAIPSGVPKPIAMHRGPLVSACQDRSGGGWIRGG